MAMLGPRVEAQHPWGPLMAQGRWLWELPAGQPGPSHRCCGKGMGGDPCTSMDGSCGGTTKAPRQLAMVGPGLGEELGVPEGRQPIEGRPLLQ